MIYATKGALMAYLAVRQMSSFQAALFAIKADRPVPTTPPRSADRPVLTKGGVPS